MNPLGDRRASVRFEIVGSLRGDLQLNEPARIVEITATGAVVESRLPIPIGPLTMALTVDERVEARVAARVPQLRRTNGAKEPSRYLITINFLSDIRPYLDAFDD